MSSPPNDFRSHARTLTARHARTLGAVVAICAVAFWPLDYAFFSPEVIAAFRIWRLGVLALGLLGVVGLGYVARTRRGVYAVVTAMLLTGSAICGHAYAVAGGLDEPWFHASNLLPLMCLPLLYPLALRIAASLAMSATFVTAYFATSPEQLSHPRVGGVLAFLVFATGVSVVMGHAIYRLTRENFHQRLELADRATRLEELDRLKNELFANVSHELRTPLTLIIASLRGLGPADRALAEAGLRNASRLLLLVDELLELARLRGAKSPARRRRVDVARLVTDVSASFAQGAEREGELVVEGTSEPMLAWIDPTQVRTALYNLIANAFKFTDAKTRRVRVRLSTAGTDLRLDVEDNGIGISPALATRIFDRFAQGDASTTRRYGGVGIGLALVKEIAAAHGGRVELDSTFGEGSRFTLVLPRGAATEGEIVPAGRDDEQLDLFAMAQRPVVAAAGAEAGAYAEGDGHRPIVLVAEDDPELRRHIARVLGATFRVVEAADGQEALSRSMDEPPDLLITDVMMPRLSGVDLVRAYRANATLARVPIVVITAAAGTEGRLDAYGAGAEDYLVKPFDDEELVARARNLIALRRKEQELRDVNAELERRVAARTAELRRLATHLETSREDERRRLAREIHDEAGQILTALRLELGVARELARGGTDLPETLARMDGMLDQALAVVRTIVSDLRPRVLDEMGLAPAIEWYVAQFRARSGVECALSIVPAELDVPPEVAIAAFRIVQEALTNVARHAKARHVTLAVRLDEGQLAVTISDDGIGFDPSRRTSSSFGLIGMSERTEALGGTLRLDSEPGRGTTLSASLPVDPVEGARASEAAG